MSRTYQVRIGEGWHEYAKNLSHSTGKSITHIMEEALKMHSGIYQQEKAESEALFKALYPNDIFCSDRQKTPKTTKVVKLSTRLKELQKATKTGECWTSKKYSADNVRKMFES